MFIYGSPTAEWEKNKIGMSKQKILLSLIISDMIIDGIKKTYGLYESIG